MFCIQNRMGSLQIVFLQELLVFLYLQREAPEGYDPDLFNGAWPEGGCWVIRLRVPPNMSSWRTPDSWHQVYILLAQGENQANHLQLGPLLQRMVTAHCDCPSGDRTNSWCSHMVAGVMGLFAPTCFRSTKILEARVTDYLR